MNKLKKFIWFTAITLGIIIFQNVYSQRWNGESGINIWSLWTLNVNAGLTSYYGDISMYDYTVSDKLMYESGSAMGLILTKQFNNSFGISAQLLTGKLKGKRGNFSFKSDLFEYNLHIRINLINVFFSNKLTKFGIIGYAGIGQFLFKTTSYRNDDGYIETETQDTGVPEFMFFYGAGICYNVTNKFGITADISLRHCQNDKLDNFLKNHDYDYYTYTNIGIIYKINSFIKPPPRNKARIAHNTRRLKPLKH